MSKQEKITSSIREITLIKNCKYVSPGYINNPGNPIVPRLKRVYNETLKKEVVQKIGELDLYEDIQASSNATDMELLKRQAMLDGSPIDPSGVGYGVNFSGLPEDIHQAYKIANDVEGQFSKLPEDLQKELFGGSSDKFVNAVIANKFDELVGSYYQEKAKAALEAAKKGEEDGQ